MTLIKWLTL